MDAIKAKVPVVVNDAVCQLWWVQQDQASSSTGGGHLCVSPGEQCGVLTGRAELLAVGSMVWPLRFQPALGIL